MKLIKKKREKNQINKIKQKWRNHNRQHRNTKDHRDYYQKLYANKKDILEEIDKFLEKYNFPKLNQE